MNARAEAAMEEMRRSIGSAGAEHWARIAYERGASREDIRKAWRLWRAEQAAEVQIIDADPRPGARCACPHVAAQHHSGTGRCLSRACGCMAFAKGGRRTA